MNIFRSSLPSFRSRIISHYSSRLLIEFLFVPIIVNNNFVTYSFLSTHIPTTATATATFSSRSIDYYMHRRRVRITDLTSTLSVKDAGATVNPQYLYDFDEFVKIIETPEVWYDLDPRS